MYPHTFDLRKDLPSLDASARSLPRTGLTPTRDASTASTQAAFDAQVDSWSPGEFIAWSTDALRSLIAVAPPEGPLPFDEDGQTRWYTRRAMMSEAIAQIKRRESGSSTSDERHGMETYPTVPEPSLTLHPARANADQLGDLSHASREALEAAVVQAPAAVPQNPTAADHEKMAKGRDASCELMKRALSPVRGRPMSFTELTTWQL
jgi:hypothetical protein